MIVIADIREQDHIESELNKRNLMAQYRKQKRLILAGVHWKGADLKYRQPKEEWRISFRINKQFRAYCYMTGNTLVVYQINNHQDS